MLKHTHTQTDMNAFRSCIFYAYGHEAQAMGELNFIYKFNAYVVVIKFILTFVVVFQNAHARANTLTLNCVRVGQRGELKEKTANKTDFAFDPPCKIKFAMD